MSVLAVVPARFASTRFPGKPLANETGKYLIQHVYERVTAAKRIDECVVATDDERIAVAVRSFGGNVEMTWADHLSGTDRVAEVVQRRGGWDSDIIVNVQGDEPELEPAYLDRLVALMRDSPCSMATLACPFPEGCDPRDPNCVKVVLNQRKEALYFSRSLIPCNCDADAGGEPWLLHLGVYAYRRAFLMEFSQWAQTALERVEKLEQLRALEHGCAIGVEVVERGSVGIDTPKDYEEFVKRRRG